MPAGHSTPCVVGERVFVTTFDGKQLATVALDAGRWQETVEASRPGQSASKSTIPPAARPPPRRPATASACSSSSAATACCATTWTASSLWSQPLGPFQDEFGSASSPILADGKLLLNEDHDIDSFLLAVDPASGHTLWKTPRDGFTRSYATPVIWSPGGRPQLVVAGALELAGYDLDSGRQLWRMEGLARIVNTTPVVNGERLYVATWSPGGDTDARIAMEPWTYGPASNGTPTTTASSRARKSTNKDVLDRFFAST